MAKPLTSIDLTGEYIPRSGVIYDPIIRGYDTSFWKTIAGTPAISSNKLRLSAAEINSYSQYLFGIFEFAVNVPTTPSGSEAKKIGLRNPAAPTIGSAYFEIAATVFKAVSYDDGGTVQSTTLTWSGEASEQIFKIQWERNFIIFSLAGTVVAVHTTRVGKAPQTLHIDNNDADNTDVGYVLVKEAGRIIT